MEIFCMGHGLDLEVCKQIYCLKIKLLWEEDIMSKTNLNMYV